MGLYLGTSDLLSGGAASEGTTKEINGYTYSNVITNPNSNLFPVSLTDALNTYTANGRADSSSWRNYNGLNFGHLNGPSSPALNTDEVIANITNASNGGFVHWIKTPVVGNNDFITLNITLDGTTYTFDTKSSGSTKNMMAGDAAYWDGNRGPGYSTAWNVSVHTSTYPKVLPNQTRGYWPTATVARQLTTGKLYFENSCNITFNISALNTSNSAYAYSGAAITLL